MTHPIPDAALDADIAILGKKGRGKTYTAKGIVERLLELKRRVLVLDPLSVWWGLRSTGDGRGAGYPVAVFGGPHGDMPLTDTMGRALARVIAANNLPMVLDMGAMTKADSIRAVLTGPQAALFEALLAAGGTIGRTDLASRVGWEPGGSNLRNRLSELSSLEIVEYPNRGGVRLQDWITE